MRTVLIFALLCGLGRLPALAGESERSMVKAGVLGMRSTRSHCVVSVPSVSGRNPSTESRFTNSCGERNS